MKKIMYLFMALLVSGVINAKENIDKKVVERVKAIVAYEMNLVSLHTDDKSSEKEKNIFLDFKEQAKGIYNIDSVMKCLPSDYANSRKLCAAIKKKKSTFDDEDALIAYYSDTIFQDKKGEIAKFVNKRKSDPKKIERLKKTVKQRICDELANTETPVEATESASEIQTKPEKQKIAKDTEFDSKRNLSANESCGFADTIKMGIGYLLSIVLAIVAIILFKNYKKIENECSKMKEDSLRINGLLQQKNDTVRDLQNKVEQLQKDKTVLEEDVKNLEEARKKQIRRDQEAKVERVNRDKEEQKIEVHEYYLGVPQNGKFTEGSDVYRRGKALYKLITIDDIHGDFEYINLPEAVGFAKQSITSFLESACNIMGECSSDFAQIETRVKGKVERTSDGWKIIKKADVCLL